MRIEFFLMTMTKNKKRAREMQALHSVYNAMLVKAAATPERFEQPPAQ